ncbi:MAG: glycerophosphodiester phosphodiesterase [Candidatus Methanospirareceae archaeon]
MKIIAHRGARVEEPENTIRAIKRAFECGADAAEIDVRLSKDKKAVVIHDDTLERTTNGYGKVREKTFDELKELDAGKGERIPSLEEALLFAKETGMELVIELKEEGMEKIVVEEILKQGLEKKVIISSFFHSSLRKIKEILPIKTGVIISSLPVFPIKLAIDTKAEVIFPMYPRLNMEMVEEAKKEGIEVYPWTINKIEDFEKVRKMGIDGIVTDNPCLFQS